MKFSRNQFLLALLLGMVWPRIATAHLGDSAARLEARYGPVVPNFFGDQVNQAGDEIGGTKVQFLCFETNHWRIFAIVVADKTRSENYTAPTNDPNHTDEYYLNLASAVTGHTNWTKLDGNKTAANWIADYSQMQIDHGVDGPDSIYISAVPDDVQTQKREYEQEVREARFALTNVSANPTGPLVPKAAMDARIMASQQALADKGDPYGERQMGLRYRDGNGVTADAAKARELLQKAAAQGDQDAAVALDSFNNITPSTNSVSFTTTNLPEITIDSAIFAWGKKSADVTQKVIDLLHDNPDGFTVDRGSLGVDPAPGKKKTLTVIFEYNGKSHTIRLHGGDDLYYGVLANHASKNQNWAD